MRREPAGLPEWTVSGWTSNGTVTAIVLLFGPKHGRNDEPRFSVMPLCGTPQSQWPPFTWDSQASRCLEEHRHPGRLIALDPVISATRAQVYWVPVAGIPELGEGMIAVRAPLPAGRHVLPAGVYAYHEALTARFPVLSLTEVLRDADTPQDSGISDLGVLLAGCPETAR